MENVNSTDDERWRDSPGPSTSMDCSVLDENSTSTVFSEATLARFNDTSITSDAPDNLSGNENEFNNDASAGSSRRPYIRKKPLTRKRQVQQSTWVDFQAKKARTLGIEGIGRKGKPIEARAVREGCKASCRLQCHTKFTPDQRQAAFHSFWKLGDNANQWNFIAHWVKRIQPNEASDTSESEYDTQKRKVSIFHQFCLPRDGEKVEVCKKMFLDTLDISYARVRTADRKMEASGIGFISQGDQRGKQEKRGRKVPDWIRNTIRNHIMLFPKIPSHYTRASTEKEYLEPGLSVSAMYRLYKKQMKAIGLTKIGTKHMYRDIFNNEFNLSFFHPKKDRCDTCEIFKLLEENEKTQEKIDDNAMHRMNAKIARDLMYQDKEKISVGSAGYTETCLACFDLQKILTTPHSNSSSWYYMRKLCVWNFTIFDLGTTNGFCNVWNETVGRRGANEISSLMWRFVSAKAATGTKKFIFVTDNCAGQNRNKIIFSMYIRICRSLKVNITHRFLEVGHTQNDGDSMHAAIERTCREEEIFTQPEWCKHMRDARVTEPYEVHEVRQDEFMNFDVLAEWFNWDNVGVSKIKEINISTNGEVSVRQSFDVEPKKLSILKRNRSWESFDSHILKQVYTAKLPLNADKIKDLRHMCQKSLIPTRYHSYYEELFRS